MFCCQVKCILQQPQTLMALRLSHPDRHRKEQRNMVRSKFLNFVPHLGFGIFKDFSSHHEYVGVKGLLCSVERKMFAKFNY